MGTTVSNLQILGVSPEDVRTALPRNLVGQWSERFVTACPDLSPRNAERRAASLSKKLDCTLLLVSMFDGDALWLTVYRGGKRLTSHVALPENCKAGNPKLFCSALGLPEELAPKLKRLFTDCAMQEEKLGILQDLLGAPLFLRWDSENDLPTEPVRADTGPLEEWLREHPLPPKVKNQCKAELLQEMVDRHPDLSGFPGAQTPVQTVVVRDSAGMLPCPFALEIDGEPAAADSLWLLPDGGFLADIRACYDGSRLSVKIKEEQLACYSPDGALRWTVPGIDVYQVTQNRIYAFRDTDEFCCLLALNLDGSTVGQYRLPDYRRLHFLGETLYVEQEDRTESLLTRLTQDLRPDGTVQVPYMPGLVLSPDGTLLYAVGYETGLRVIDAKSLQILHDLPRRDRFHSPVVDGQNRLWVTNGGCFECYTPELECISRHKLKGSVCRTYCSADGHACALTFQKDKYILRVYRFT